MKNRHIKILSLLLLFSALNCSFVDAQANLWFGGGSNFAKMRKVYAQETISQEDNMRAGFNLGLYISQAISENMGIETALVYDTKGYVSKYDDAWHMTERFKTHYIDLYPFSLRYYYALDNKQSLYGKTGPMIGLGLFGMQSQSDENGYYEQEIDWNKLELERVDFAWNFSLGYDFNKALQAEIGYDMGLRNITDNTNEYLTLRNNCIKITAKVSLSYLFSPVMEDGKFINKKKKEAEVLE